MSAAVNQCNQCNSLHDKALPRSGAHRARQAIGIGGGQAPIWIIAVCTPSYFSRAHGRLGNDRAPPAQATDAARRGPGSVSGHDACGQAGLSASGRPAPMARQRGEGWAIRRCRRARALRFDAGRRTSAVEHAGTGAGAVCLAAGVPGTRTGAFRLVAEAPGRRRRGFSRRCRCSAASTPGRSASAAEQTGTGARPFRLVAGAPEHRRRCFSPRAQGFEPCGQLRLVRPKAFPTQAPGISYIDPSRWPMPGRVPAHQRVRAGHFRPASPTRKPAP